MKKLKKLSRDDLKTAKGGEKQVWVAEFCGQTATTTQDWTPAQANQWLANLEANYCN